MGMLKNVENDEDLMCYIKEQTILYYQAVVMGCRIINTYRDLHEDRIAAYLEGNDRFYDFYSNAEWELMNATFEIKRQIADQAMHLEYVSNIIL